VHGRCWPWPLRHTPGTSAPSATVLSLLAHRRRASQSSIWPHSPPVINHPAMKMLAGSKVDTGVRGVRPAVSQLLLKRPRGRRPTPIAASLLANALAPPAAPGTGGAWPPSGWRDALRPARDRVDARHLAPRKCDLQQDKRATQHKMPHPQPTHLKCWRRRCPSHPWSRLRAAPCLACLPWPSTS
jgi:hypothetical protein